MKFLLIIYCACNFFTLLFISETCAIGAEELFARIFVYPYINEKLDNINLAGKIIIYTLFTIAFLPALVVYYVILLGVFIIAALCVAFQKVFKKKG